MIPKLLWASSVCKTATPPDNNNDDDNNNNDDDDDDDNNNNDYSKKLFCKLKMSTNCEWKQFIAAIFLLKMSKLGRQRHPISVTGWLDYFNCIWPFTTKKIYPTAFHICYKGLTFFAKFLLNKHWKFAKDLKFCQSGEISPNLVTLQPKGLSWEFQIPIDSIAPKAISSKCSASYNY